MREYKKLRFYNSLQELYKKESTLELKEKYWEYSINTGYQTIFFKDWFFKEQKFYRFDNDIYVTTDSSENLDKLIELFEIALKKINKTITDYYSIEQLINVIEYELDKE